MKKLAVGVFVCLLAGIIGSVHAKEKNWTMSLPGYNMGTTYSYYQPNLSSFKRLELGYLDLDPIAHHSTIWSPGFAVRYSITPNLQIGLHFNNQHDQWARTVTGTGPDTVTTDTRTVANIKTYLPTAVLVYRIPVGSGHFSIGPVPGRRTICRLLC